jgi:hypothetical protein
MPQRYGLREEPGGFWMVVDRYTGRPATDDDVPLINLTIEKADEMVELLNYRHRRRRENGET